MPKASRPQCVRMLTDGIDASATNNPENYVVTDKLMVKHKLLCVYLFRMSTVLMENSSKTIQCSKGPKKKHFA